MTPHAFQKSADAFPATVGLGEARVSRGGPQKPWVIYGLGSCIGLVLTDPKARVAAIAHVVLPHGPSLRPDKPGKYANTATPHLLNAMIRLGADPSRIAAQIAGGAKMLQLSAMSDIGERNIQAIRAALKSAGVPIVAESVGGNAGRTLRFDWTNGVAVIRRVGREDLILTPPQYRFEARPKPSEEQLNKHSR